MPEIAKINLPSCQEDADGNRVIEIFAAVEE